MSPPADTQQQDESLAVTGPFGIKAEAKGDRAMLWLIAIVFVGVVPWFLWRHHETQESNHREAQSNHREVKDAFSEMTYVLSLSQEERQRLRLDMPDSLRKRVKRDRD